MNGVFALRAYQPFAFRVYQPAALPDRSRSRAVALVLRRPGHRVERVRAGEALQLRFPALAERNAAGMFGDLADHRRHDDLTAARLARNTGGKDHGFAEEPLRLLDRFAGVQANAHPNQLLGMGGAVCRERLLDRNRAAEPGEGVREGEEEAVTLQFELDTAVHAELLADDRVV